MQSSRGHPPGRLAHPLDLDVHDRSGEAIARAVDEVARQPVGLRLRRPLAA
jgi:hypothetical protein